MTTTKRITRISAIVLLVVFLMSSMATFAMAAQQHGCTTTSSKTFTVTKKKGTPIKITALQKGRVMQQYTNYTFGWWWGRYDITIKYPNGTVKTMKWNQRLNGTKTLVGAFQAKGTYTITVSEPKEWVGLSAAAVGAYWRTYPQFNIKY